MSGYIRNDGRFPTGSPVEVRYPTWQEPEPGRWSWVPATVLGQRGRDTWHVRITAEHLAVPDSAGRPSYPSADRDASQIRRPA